MRSLRVVVPAGVDVADAASLILEADDGERFALPADDALGALTAPDPVTGADRPVDPAPPTRSVPPAEPVRPATPPVALSPREIQVRVRAGESPADLAADTGNPVDRIMRFATAVLEERARVTDEARRARARRDGDGNLVPFGETVDRRFQAHGIDPQAVGWDAFRRPDGTWVVTAAWNVGAGDRQAHWAFSLTARTVLPADESGSDLLSDRPLRPIVRAVPDQSAEVDAGEAVYDQETASYTRPRTEPATTAAAAATDPAARTAEDGRAGPPADRTRLSMLRLADPLPAAADDAAGVLGAAVLGETEHADVTTVVGPGARTGPVQVGPADGGPGDPTDPTDPTDRSAPAGPSPTDRPANDLADRPPDLFDGVAGAEHRAPVRRGAGRGKAAREQTKIPSWDDILLGVRRRQE